MRESDFQKNLIRELKTIFPGCVVLKNDENYLQGFPDLLILFGKAWAALECKKSMKAPHRPNQDYYVHKLGLMSYANFICPENKEVVLNEIQKAFQS